MAQPDAFLIAPMSKDFLSMSTTKSNQLKKSSDRKVFLVKASPHIGTNPFGRLFYNFYC